MNLLLENKYGVPSRNFVKKNVLCEKGDEITRFDGTLFLAPIDFLKVPAQDVGSGRGGGGGQEATILKVSVAL
jgi:hypothetical protein